MQTALILLALAIIALLIFASTKPGQYTVSRSIAINASAEKIHATINTPREFERWSPYSLKDPQMTNTYSGPTSGVGARNGHVQAAASLEQHAAGGSSSTGSSTSSSNSSSSEGEASAPRQPVSAVR